MSMTMQKEVTNRTRISIDGTPPPPPELRLGGEGLKIVEEKTHTPPLNKELVELFRK